MTALQNKNAEITFFDNFVEHADYDVFDERGYQRISKEFFACFHPRPGLRILDMGCGTGAFTARFSRDGCEVWGIDISSKSIEYAKKKYPNIHFEVGDIEQTHYENDMFDIIILSGVLHHFPNFSPVVEECWRIVKKGGLVLGYDPHYHNPFVWTFRSKHSPFRSTKGVTANEQPLKKQQIEETFRLHHFSDIRIFSISGITYKYVENSLAFMLLPMYNAIEKLLDMIPCIRDRIGSFVITYAQK